MLDLHCHLLPGIDDGPPDVAESVRLARQGEDEGVRVIAATPHCRDDHPGVVPGELGDRCRDLSSTLFDEGVLVRVVPGGEVDLVWGLEASDDDLRLVSYGQKGTDLLVELSLKGYRLLLAHPERNSTFQEDPKRIVELVRRGHLVQVTASSLIRSPKESRSGRLARQLVCDGFVHVLASDAHGPAAPGRATLNEGRAIAARLVGRRRARWMVDTAPAAIIAGQPIPKPPPLAPRRRGLRRLTG
ncbi:MAG TPA: CpsB/CapC family capsule biosynthesis tyrosine phosphatase [Thermoleophilaceae bacterium]|nr:CpsB/CapC family capsule biosynthesis tyrosine phosphatase [Thermoleophilaceae bacterium]